MVARVPPGAGECIPGPWKTTLGRCPNSQTGAEDRPTDAGDRFFKKLLATHRRAEVAGIGWKAAIYGSIQEQVRREAGMSIAEMCAVAQVNRAGYYRFLTTPE